MTASLRRVSGRGTGTRPAYSATGTPGLGGRRACQPAAARGGRPAQPVVSPVVLVAPRCGNERPAQGRPAKPGLAWPGRLRLGWAARGRWTRWVAEDGEARSGDGRAGIRVDR